MGRPTGTHKRPAREAVLTIAAEEANRDCLNPKTLFTPSKNRIIMAARRRAWKRVHAETGCSINGLADVWGFDRQAVWRVIRGKVAA